MMSQMREDDGSCGGAASSAPAASEGILVEVVM